MQNRHDQWAAAPALSRWRRIAIAAWALASPAASFGYATGINGYSGLNARTCSTGGGCHTDSSAVAPVVSFEGPVTITAGTSATYRFVVRSQSAGQVAAGFNTAASGGALTVLAPDNDGVRLAGPALNRELTHRAPKPNTDGMASFSFTWTAPLTPGAQTLFAAGNSVNLSNTSEGDFAAATTFVIDVVPAPDTPTPEDTPTPTDSPAVTDSPTPTPTAPNTDTPTAIPATPRPTCAGDCNGDREVTVDELVRGVNIALGATGVDACPSFDTGANGEVTVDELVRGVNAALSGCPS